MGERAMDGVRTEAWLLMGATGNLPGFLSLADGRFTFVSIDGETVFDAPVSAVGEVKVPWYYFGGGMKLTVGSERYRLSFVPPTAAGGGMADIPAGRRACKMWKSLLVPSSSANR
ncbi:MAG TPA: hypothetical protein VFJ16_27870 [Longimicrobium sp.]|nr:hypothetical protein [Longimicrobium sp.]